MTDKSYKKKLIEVAIPLEAINEGSAYEKLPGIGPHPRGIHLWWARRPHVACRSILFSQLVDDPSSNPEKFPSERAQKEERRRLFGIIEGLANWKNSTDETLLKNARAAILESCDNNLPTICDPFSGGGSIPLEAQRLGLPALGSDLNPVAVMIGKAMIEIPGRFKNQRPIHPGGPGKLTYKNADGLAEDVRYYGDWMQERAKMAIGNLYPLVKLPQQYGGGTTPVIAWLWARTVKCPNPGCGFHTPLITSFVLSSKKGRERYLVPEFQDGELEFDISSSFPQSLGNPKNGYKRGQSGIFDCARCKTPTTRDYVANEGINNRIGFMQTAVVVEGKRCRLYLPSRYSPLPLDIPKKNDAGLKSEFQANPRDLWCKNFGLMCPADLFTKRQLAALNKFSDLIPEVRDEIRIDAAASGMSDDSTSLRVGGCGSYAYAEALSVYLAFAIDRTADFNNLLTGWRSGNEKIMYLFSRQAIPMVWDFGEANILGNGVGGFLPIVAYQSKCIEKLCPNGEGKLNQSNAIDVKFPKHSVISTDPPYYDNIGYADISDFFYVWMKKSLGTIYPDLFNTLMVPKSEELVAIPYRQGSKIEAEKFFLSGMTEAIANIARQTTDQYPTTIYYAFKQNEISAEGLTSTGWATFIEAIISSGFSVVATWPIRSEQTYRMIASGTNALATSVVLVCRKRDVSAENITRGEFVRALKLELPPALHELQKANITPVDMPQASIGPGIGIFSRYKTVLESDDAPMTVKTALQIINRELDAFLTEQEGEFDADTRFAVTWFEQNGMKAGNFGDADNLARARGLSVDNIKHAGIVESAAGKVRLIAREELADDWTPANDSHLTIWECTQHLIRALENDGEYGAAVLLKKMGPEATEAARDLAYRLFDICDKQSRAKEASSYNALIAVWSDLTAQAATISDEDLAKEQLSLL